MRVSVLVIAAVLAGCNTTETPAPAVETVALPAPVKPTRTAVDGLKSAAGKKLKDPYSAQWERLQQAMRPNVRGEPMEVICGHVNAKNSVGAYTGAKSFVYFVADRDLFIEGGDDIVARDVIKRFCTGLI